MKLYTALIADDEPLIARNLVECVSWEELGFEIVAVCHDGRSALNESLRLHPDVVLTDIRMPGMDGLELVRALSEALPGTQTVLVSGYAEFSYAREALRRDALAYLLKPIDPDELREALHRARTRLERPDAPKPAASAPKVSPKLQLTLDYIEAHICEKLSLNLVAKAVFISPNYLSQLFRKELDTTFTQYFSEKQIAWACERLREPDTTAAEVACALGYSDYFYFSRVFKKITHQSPSSYQAAALRGDRM